MYFLIEADSEKDIGTNETSRFLLRDSISITTDNSVLGKYGILAWGVKVHPATKD